jgi:hypothetical protein
VFKYINNQTVITSVFKAAGLTYGPLLGLFFFGLFTRLQVRDKLVPIVCVLSVLLSFLLNSYSSEILNGYKIGFELLLINGLITGLGLLFISKKKNL